MRNVTVCRNNEPEAGRSVLTIGLRPISGLQTNPAKFRFPLAQDTQNFIGWEFIHW